MEMGASVVKTSVVRPLRWLGATLLDQLYPPVCLACDAPVATADALCTTCFRGLRPITAPLCPILGLPFEVSLGPDAVSAEAIAHPPNFDRARSAVVYNAMARGLVGKLKYGDRPELARFCARLMAGNCGSRRCHSASRQALRWASGIPPSKPLVRPTRVPA